MSEGDMQFHCSLGGKILPDRTNSTELAVAGFSGLADKFSMDSVLSRRTPMVLRESDCAMKLSTRYITCGSERRSFAGCSRR